MLPWKNQCDVFVLLVQWHGLAFNCSNIGKFYCGEVIMHLRNWLALSTLCVQQLAILLLTVLTFSCGPNLVFHFQWVGHEGVVGILKVCVSCFSVRDGFVSSVLRIGDFVTNTINRAQAWCLVTQSSLNHPSKPACYLRLLLFIF